MTDNQMLKTVKDDEKCFIHRWQFNDPSNISGSLNSHLIWREEQSSEQEQQLILPVSGDTAADAGVAMLGQQNSACDGDEALRV